MPARLRLALTALVVAAAVALVAVGVARVRVDTTASSFLSTSDPSQRATLEVARSFGGDAIVVLAETARPGALLEGDQLSRMIGLEGGLSRLQDVAVVYGPGTLLNQIAGQGQDLMASISGRRDGLRMSVRAGAEAAGDKPSVVRSKVARALRAFDLRYAGLLVRGLPAGLPTVRNASFVRSVVFDTDGGVRPTWRFLIPDPTSAAIIIRPREQMDQAATERLVDATRAAVADAHLATSRVTITGMPVVAAGLGGALRQEMPLLAGIAIALIVACYLLFPWLTSRWRRLLPVAATLTATAATLALFGWLHHPLSIGVVAFLPILLGTGSDFPAYLTRGADRRKVVVTALAAAAGFGALAVSPVPFVRDLGIALATGVVIALGIGLLLTGGDRARQATRDASEQAVPSRPSAPAASRATRGAVLVVAVVLAGLGWVAMPHLRLGADPQALARGVPALDDAAHAEGIIGSSGEIDVLVRGDDLATPGALAWMSDVQRVLLRRFGDDLRPVVSAPSLLAFLGTSPTRAQVLAGLDQLPPYLRTAVMRDDGRAAIISLGVVPQDVSEQERVIAAAQRAVPAPPKGVDVEFAGLPVVTGRAYDLVSSTRYLDALAGVAAAGAVLLIGLRRRRDALRGVLAAGLSAGWGLAGALVLGIGLTPLTVALGSLATATACEFTVLLDGRPHGGNRRAVLVAASAATCGYLALAASRLAVIRDFGLFLAATVLLSLVAAHLVRFVLPTDRPASEPREAAPAALPEKELVL